jgi:RNA polymerase sigma-70 factor (ECF subfamily)
MNLMPISNELPEALLERARSGDAGALGRLLEMYRNYLRILARTQINSALKVRCDPSDLVQETLMEAHRDFLQFAGISEKELMVWLRRILVRNLTDQIKRQKSQGRTWERQESLDILLDQSSSAVEEALGKSISTPSVQASRREQAVLLADALAHLPADYREVIVLRNMERLSFETIAQRMQRSSGAVRMLWARALEKLSRILQGDKE